MLSKKLFIISLVFGAYVFSNMCIAKITQTDSKKPSFGIDGRIIDENEEYETVDPQDEEFDTISEKTEKKIKDTGVMFREAR